MIVATLSADGNSDAFTINGSETVSIRGTWGGGTATLQKKYDGVTWGDLTVDGTAEYSVTGDTTKIVEGNHTLRFALSGSTSPSLKVYVE